MKLTNERSLVVDTYEAIEENGNFGYEITFYNDIDDTVIDLKYGFKSHKAAEKAGQAFLNKLNKGK